MQKFYYNEKQQLTALLVQLNSAAEKFSSRDFDATASLLQVLNDGIALYKKLGYSERESQLQVQRAELVTAQRGVNPISLEKQLLRRNEMLNSIAFKVLQSMELLLRNDVLEREAKLEEAGQLVAQVIVAAMQSGLLKDDDIKRILKQPDLEATWASLGKDANIALGQKRVLLLVNRFDALILFDDLLAPFKD